MRSSIVSTKQQGLAQQFNNLRADAAGSASLLAHQMAGYFTLSTNPTVGKTLTLTVNGSPVTFTFSATLGSTPGNVVIGGSATATSANLLALLLQPQTTTTTGVALSVPDQTLVGYLGYLLVGTTLYISTSNANAYAPVSSFSGATNATGDSYTAQTMALVIEPGTASVAGTQLQYAGGITPTFTAPVSNPRFDLVTIDGSGTVAIVTGTEAASPSVPAYPSGVVTLCEVHHSVGETAIFDNANQTSGQGYIQRDSRPFINITQVIMAGLIMMWPAASAPLGWLLCDGSAVSRVTYAALYALVGTTYGSGDGSTTFNLPDLRGRVPVGKNAGTFSSLGGTGGEETHTLSSSEIPAHNHGIGYSVSGFTGSGYMQLQGSAGNADEAFTDNSTGGGGAHNNLQPYLTLNFIIKA